MNRDRERILAVVAGQIAGDGGHEVRSVDQTRCVPVRAIRGRRVLGAQVLAVDLEAHVDGVAAAESR